LRRRLPSGGFERLSTAEIDVDLECPPLFNVIQHRGLANLPPPDEAARVLEAYLSMCRRDELPVDRLGLAPMSAIDTVEEQCGYDWRKPGNVEKAIAIWSPCLPGHVRRMTPREIATRTLEGSDHRSDHQCR
jgi:hypothetical protein